MHRKMGARPAARPSARARRPGGGSPLEKLLGAAQVLPSTETVFYSKWLIAVRLPLTLSSPPPSANLDWPDWDDFE